MNTSNSVIDLSSVLLINTKYRVVETTKMPLSKQFIIGKEVLLLSINNKTASVRHGGNKHEVPVRALINVVGYTCKGVAHKNADGFVVVSKNKLGLEVGTAYLNPVAVSDTTFTVEVDGKRITVPLDIVCSLVKNVKAESNVGVKKIKNNTQLSDSVIETTAELMAPSDNRQDIERLPAVVQKLLPNTNLSVLRAHLRQSDGVYADYEGNLFNTIEEADKSNTKIRHKLLQDKLMVLINKRIENEFEQVRTKDKQE